MESRKLLVVALLTVMLAGTGCAQTVDIQFDAPSGSTMTVGGQTYELPEMLSLEAPKESALVETPSRRREEVAFTFPLGGDTVTAEGVLDLYKFHETDVDRYARNTCVIEPEQIQRMRDGYAVVIDGHSASDQRIYRLTMGEK